MEGTMSTDSVQPKVTEKLPQSWSELPRYLHLFTVGYFATNFFNIWAYNEMAPHPAVGLMALVGFVGGLAEHMTPYFPRLTIPVTAEKILFRIPTILATVLVFWSLDPWLPWSLLVAAWAIYFWRAPGLSSLELGFHLRHFGVTHVGGTCGTLAMLGVFYEKSELLTQLFRGWT
jgi:hypothetical protein